MRPAAASWNKKLGEFILMYDDVRQSESPRDTLLEFLQSTYDAGARLAKWDAALEAHTGITRRSHDENVCSHLEEIRVSTTNKRGCEECLKSGDSWVHLRLCMECGQVGCCDSSKNKHATKHFHRTQHPLVRSLEPGESWIWCYVDQDIVGDADV